MSASAELSTPTVAPSGPSLSAGAAQEFEIVDPLIDPRWDTWVGACPDATVFHTSQWARVLADTYGLKPRYATAVDENDRRLLLPVMEVNSWVTGRRAISLPFSDECPPLGLSSGLFEKAFGQLRAQAGKHGWRSIECRGSPLPSSDARPSSTYYKHSLDLRGGEAAVFNRFHPSVRRAIRKAEKSELTLDVVASEASIRDFFELQCLTRRRHGLPPQPIEFFQSVRRRILDQGLGFMVLARQNGRAVAGVVFFHLGKGAMFKFGASDSRFQALRPTNLVLWQAIRMCLDRGVENLHFGRNALSHQCLRRFKLAWGTVEEQIHYYKYDCEKQSYAAAHDLLNGWQNHVFRRLPLGVARLVGRVLYRHIA